MNFRQKTGKTTLLLSFGFLLGRPLAFLIFRHMAQLEGSTGTGIWGVAVELTGILVVVAGFGLDNLITREIIKTPANRAAIFWTSLKLRLLTGLAGYLILVGFVKIAGYDSLTSHAVLIMAIGVFFEIWAMAADSVFQARDKIQRQTLSQVISTLVYFSLAWYLLGEGWGLMGIVWASLLSRGLRLVLVLIFVMPLLKEPQIALVQQPPSMRWLARLGLPLFFASTLGVMAYKIDTVLVMSILGKADTGVYTAGRRLMDLMVIVPHMFALAVFPLLQQSRQESQTNLDRLQENGRKAMQMVILAAIPLTLGCVVAAEPLIHLLVSNPEFNAAIPVLRIVILGLPLISINFVANRLLLSLGRESLFFWISLAGLAVSVSLNILLLPRLGINGAAVASVATLLAGWLVYYSLLRKTGLQLNLVIFFMQGAGLAAGSWIAGVSLLQLFVPQWNVGWYSIPGGNLASLIGTATLVGSIYLAAIFIQNKFKKRGAESS